MVNVQWFLLSLLPVITDQPAPIFLTPTFAAAITDNGIDDFLYAINVAEEEQRQHEHKSQARPEIRGQHITEDWLQTPKDRDCLWRFQYIADHNLLC